jgi:ribosomal protein S27AE
MAAPPYGTQFGAQPMATPPPGPPQKPTGAFILSLIGGIFILLWGLLLADVGSRFGVFGSALTALGALEALLGLLVMIFGILLYVMPTHHTAFGVLVLVFSIASLIGLGGLFLGFILGLIGGILGIVHKPYPVQTQTVVYVQQPQRMCTKCGRAVAMDVKFCPYCGNNLG